MLSDNIRKYRKANQMSQDELAEKLKVTRQSISLWETGQTQPSLDNIVALAKLFRVSTDALLTEAPTSGYVSPASAQPKAVQRSRKPILLVVILVLILAALIVVVVLLNRGEDKADDRDSGSTVAAEAADPTDPVTTEPTAAENTQKDLYGALKAFVVEKGTLNGDYCYYSQPADLYGGYSDEDFTLYYWGDTDTVEFCLHSVLDDTFSINFYLRVPKDFNGEFEYISSYYYRDTGAPLYEARGVITAAEFTKKYPLMCTEYYGSSDMQDDFMEMSRLGLCDLIACLESFVSVENFEYSFADFGFNQF